MADQWFMARNKQKHGPYSAAQLKEFARTGQLQPTDMIWKEGMPKWVPVQQVKGLFPQTSPSLVSQAAPNKFQPVAPIAMPLPAQPAADPLLGLGDGVAPVPPKAPVATLSPFVSKARAFLTSNWTTKKIAIVGGVAGGAILLLVLCVVFFLMDTGPPLTADYLPHIPGRVRKYEAKDYLDPINSGSHVSAEKSDGTVAEEKIGGLRFKSRHRQEGAFVGGVRTYGGKEHFFALIKIGAKVGDTWETGSYDPSMTMAFCYEKALTHRAKPCAIISQKEYKKGTHNFMVKYWFVKGIGLVHRESQVLRDGKWVPKSEVSYEEW